MTEEELNALIGESRLPDDVGDLFSAEKATTPESAFTNLEYREQKKSLLSLLRQMSDGRFSSKKDSLPLDMMEQRFIDPRDYGADPPPNAPQIPRQSQNREWKSLFAIMERWQNQLSQRKRDRRYDFDREKWIEPSPPQLTGRSRNRIAF